MHKFFYVPVYAIDSGYSLMDFIVDRQCVAMTTS